MDELQKFLGSIFGEGSNVLDALGLTGGSLLTKEAYDKLGEIGQTGLLEGQALAEKGLTQTEFKPFGVTTTTGGMFNYDPVTGQVRMSGSEQESALQQAYMDQARTLMGGPIFGQQMGREAARGAFDLGTGMMEAAGGDTAAREQEIYQRARAVQSPEEERQRLALEERLQAQGRGGVRTAMFGGTPEQLAMEKAQAEARNRAAYDAMGQARSEQAQQAAIGAQYSTLGSQLAAQDQARMMGQQQLGLGALTGAYLPQQQLLAAQQAAQLFPQLQQRGQLYGAGLYGEGVASGLDMLLGSGLGQATLIGNLGTGLLSGVFGVGRGK